MRILIAALSFTTKVIVMTGTTIAATMGTASMDIAPYHGNGLLLVMGTSALMTSTEYIANRIGRALGAGQRQSSPIILSSAHTSMRS